jgi:serine/threonine-protein kinase
MSDVLRSTGPLHPDRAAEIASDVAGALSTAHAAGLVHRDIKLGNILVSDSGDVKVADFGIATALVSGGDAALTQHGSVMGTATYFSPEQAQGKALDGRSDLYSLGVVLYEMLAGVPPFQAETPVAVAYKHVQERPDGLIDRGVQVAESLQAITMKLLAKSPANRYPTADDLRNDLRRYLAGAHRISGKGAAAAGGAAAGAVAGAAAAGAAGSPTESSAEHPVTEPPATAAIPPVDATTAQPVTPTPAPGLPQQPGQPAAGYVDPAQHAAITQQQAAYGAAGYYYEEPPRGGGIWRTVALLASLGVLIVILGFLFASFLDALGGDDDNTPDEVVVDVVDVPSVEGLDVQEARELLLEAGLAQPDVEFETNDEVPVNQVFAQNPPPGERVEPNSVVTLRVSSGTADTVPSVIGSLREEAVATLQEFQYVVTEVTAASPQDAGTVISQSPSPGSVLAPGSTVEITVSTGPEVMPVPDVEGLDVIAAVNALREEGFVVNATQIEEPSEEIEEGKVTRTEPAAAQLVAVGSQISIVVSTGVPTVPVPSVVNLLTDSAVNTIRSEGLVVGGPIFVDVPAGSPSDGRVISQDPEPFEEVEIGFVVTITVGQAVAPTTTYPTPPPTTTYPTTP